MRRVVLLVSCALLLAVPLHAARRRSISRDSCSVTISSAAIALPMFEGIADTVTGAFTVKTSGCSDWVPVSGASWLKAARDGDTVKLTATVNMFPTRSTLVHVRSAAVVVTQTGISKVVNGGFDSNLAGWSDAEAFSPGSISWVAAPPIPSPGDSPGVALVKVTNPHPGSTAGHHIGQCIEVVPGHEIRMGWRYFVPEDNPTDTHAFLAVSYYSDTRCGSFIQDARPTYYEGSQRGKWSAAYGAWAGLKTASSVLFVASIQTQASSCSMYVDELSLYDNSDLPH